MSVTFGSGTAPSQVTLNLDSLFGLSLAAYRKTLVDNIGSINAFFHEVIKGELYESQDGGSYIQEPLMYALQNADSYDGYDELSTIPVDGITDAIYQWRQCAAAVVYSMREIKQNKQKIVDLVKSRIMQAELGLQEYFAQALLWGSVNSGGSLTSAMTSLVNGSASIDPLPLHIHFTPTSSVSIGNINQNTNTWWQNKSFNATSGTPSATGYDNFMLCFDHAFNNTSLGTGGRVNLVLTDEITYELLVHAIWQKYRQVKTNENYPFENTLYKNATITMDDKVPDVYTGVSSAATYGTAYMINSRFFKLRYDEDSDFEMLKNENGQTFQKPVNGDSRVGHIAWMGNLTSNNRRKQGVLGQIPRTLTNP